MRGRRAGALSFAQAPADRGRVIESGEGKRRRPRWRWLLWLPLVFVVATSLQVALLRFVDPPFSAFMLGRQAAV